MLSLTPFLYVCISHHGSTIAYHSYQNRYRELLRASRQWRVLLLKKRFGYGHTKDKVPGKGDLALFCPACPQPGVNLADDWVNDPDKFVF